MMIRKFLKGIGLISGAVAAMVLIWGGIRHTGQKINNKTPEGGINETEFIEINGTKQWISIYGQDVNAPVLLYLHGGPFSATSVIDWTCLRKLSKDYIIVNWDQRGCGHNYPDYKETSAPTSETMMQDGREITDYLRSRFGREKITLMGFSWGSVLGSNLVLESPEKYDAMIALSLVVNFEESQKLFKDYMLEQTENDPKLHKIAENIDTSVWNSEKQKDVMPLIRKYSYTDNVFKDADISFFTTFFFNPYCKLSESFRMYFGSRGYNDYSNNILRPDITAIINPLELSGRTEYKVPFYLVEGKGDHSDITMAEEATAYYEKITAPDKNALYLEGGHNSPLMKTEQLAEFVHHIAEKNENA